MSEIADILRAEGITVTEIHVGDREIIVLRCGRKLTPEMAERIRTEWQRAFDVPVGVLDADVEIGKLALPERE